MIGRSGQPTFFHCQKAIVRRGQTTIQHFPHAERMTAANYSDFTLWQRPIKREAGEQLRHAAAHGPAPESVVVQARRHLASAVRCSYCDNAARLLVGMKMKQRADQDATETVAHEMQRVRVPLVKEMCQPPGVYTQIGAHGRIRKVPHGETLVLHSSRQRVQKMLRKPQAVDENDGLLLSGNCFTSIMLPRCLHVLAELGLGRMNPAAAFVPRKAGDTLADKCLAHVYSRHSFTVTMAARLVQEYTLAAAASNVNQSYWSCSSGLSAIAVSAGNSSAKTCSLFSRTSGA